MKRKAIIAALLAVCVCGTFIGCGDSSSSKSEKDVESKLNSMSDSQIEKKVEKAAESIEAEAVESDSSKETQEETPAEIVYEPTDEIKNADFASGKVQIGNDVFRNGGYLTVDQFVAEFGAKYDMSELNPDSLTKAKENKSVTITSLEDPELKVSVHYDNRNAEGDKVRLGDAAVMEVIGSADKCWYPQGVKGNGEGYDYSSIPTFIEGNGFKNVTKSQASGENSKNSGIYWEESKSGKEMIKFRELGTDVNLYGFKPVFEYSFTYSMEDTKATRFECDVKANESWMPKLAEVTPIA